MPRGGLRGDVSRRDAGLLSTEGSSRRVRRRCSSRCRPQLSGICFYLLVADETPYCGLSDESTIPRRSPAASRASVAAYNMFALAIPAYTYDTCTERRSGHTGAHAHAECACACIPKPSAPQIAGCPGHPEDGGHTGDHGSSDLAAPPLVTAEDARGRAPPHVTAAAVRSVCSSRRGLELEKLELGRVARRAA